MAERRPTPLVDIEAALADLAHHIDHPRAPDLSSAVVARLAAVDHHPSRLRGWHLAIAAALLLIVLLSFPAPREAVADWLGIGTVRVIQTDQVPDRTGTALRLGTEVSLEDAGSRGGFTILGPSSLGTPSAVYAGEPSFDSVTLLWGPGDRVPPVGAKDVGVLLTAMPGSTDRTLIEKQLGPDTNVETVTVGDRVGFWIAGGQHELQYLDQDGEVRLDTTRLAANTLLWERDGVTFRLESGLEQVAAIELAESLEPLS